MDRVGDDRWRIRDRTRPGVVPRLRHDVVAVLEREFSGVDLESARLVVTELVSNVVRHAYPTGKEGPLEIEVERDADAAAVTVRDWGHGFGYSQDRGLGSGLGIVTTLAHHVHINRDNECTTVRVLLTPSKTAGT